MSTPHIVSRVIVPTPRKRAVRLQARQSLVPSSSHAQRSEKPDDDDEFVDVVDDDAQHVNATIRPAENTKRNLNPYFYWKHGNHIDHKNEDTGVWTEKWQCKLCPKTRYALGSSGNAIKHLAEKHGIYSPTKPRTKSLLTPAPSITSTIDNSNNIDGKELKTAIVAHFAADHVPFYRIESPSFRNLLHVINPQVGDVLPKTADTMKTETMKIVAKKMPEIGGVLRHFGPVHIAFDGWTSDIGHGLEGIVGYIFNPLQLKILPVLLGMKEVDGKHTGANIASCVSKTLDQYQIKDKTGYYVLDNASNNDTAVDKIEGVDSGKRLRCILHIINLCARALFSSKPDDNSDEPATKWRRLQAIVKLQAIAKRILNSPNWKKKYGQAFKLMIKMENSTRWNSVCDMISSVLGEEMALNRFVREMVEEVVDKNDKRKLEESILSADDWEVLHEIQKILKPFKTSTTMLEGCLH